MNLHCLFTGSVILAFAVFLPRAVAETRIMLVSDKVVTGSFELYSIKADGTDLVRMTTTATISEWAPVLSPNGMRIAMVNWKFAQRPF